MVRMTMITQEESINQMKCTHPRYIEPRSNHTYENLSQSNIPKLYLE